MEMQGIHDDRIDSRMMDHSKDDTGVLNNAEQPKDIATTPSRPVAMLSEKDKSPLQIWRVVLVTIAMILTVFFIGLDGNILGMEP